MFASAHLFIYSTGELTISTVVIFVQIVSLRTSFLRNGGLVLAARGVVGVVGLEGVMKGNY
jgi:hypothetical protein